MPGLTAALVGCSAVAGAHRVASSVFNSYEGCGEIIHQLPDTVLVKECHCIPRSLPRMVALIECSHTVAKRQNSEARVRNRPSLFLRGAAPF